MIIPFPAGGGLDVVGRQISAKFMESTGQSLLLINQGGAGGLIGTETVARATPNGYTVLMASNGQVSMAPWLYSKLNFDPMADLVPVTHLVDAPMLLFASNAFSAQSVKDLVAMAKAQPGKVGVALAAVGGMSHLTTELFKQSAGIELLDVPYKGAGAAMSDVVGGSVPLIFAQLASGKGLMDAGRLRALAVVAPKRMASLPNLPTFKELGYGGLEAQLWMGMMAPKGTPAPVIAALNAEFTKALASPEVEAMLGSQGQSVVAGGPREFSQMIRKDAELWRGVIKTANIKLD
jgi:tripartite-type tricarboxylate transporter receptor subunit TctC